MTIADELATWAVALVPSQDDFELAERSLVDTIVVSIAAREHPLTHIAHSELSTAGSWATVAHILDFDDLHLPSTTHISAVCVPAVLASGGGAREYLAAAGVMARVGTALGWAHYTAGWHATTTAGALAAAVGAGLSIGLSMTQIATAIAFAVPAAGGTRRAFGTDAKSLQVGFAAEAGVRAAHLAAAGATADLEAVEVWMDLIDGDASALRIDEDAAIPGGLAVKLYPACYALQRPIGAIRDSIGHSLNAEDIRAIRIRTPEATVAPLIHHRPATGFEAKFSLEYAVATALIDDHQGFDAFSSPAVQRPEVQRLVELVEVILSPGGSGLLDGEVYVEIDLEGGDTFRGALAAPPGSPLNPAAPETLQWKVAECLRGSGVDASDITWDSAASILHREIPSRGTTKAEKGAQQ